MTLYSVSLTLTGMRIGFSQRVQTVSENMTLPGDLYSLFIEIATNRVSEREHVMRFRLDESMTTAGVNSVMEPFDNLDFDVLFGGRDDVDSPLTLTYTLPAGMTSVPSLRVFIRNDIVPEEEESFSILVSPISFGYRCRCLSFSCSDALDATNYFCEHKVLIADDDGKLLDSLLECIHGTILFP